MNTSRIDPLRSGAIFRVSNYEVLRSPVPQFLMENDAPISVTKSSSTKKSSNRSFDSDIFTPYSDEKSSHMKVRDMFNQLFRSTPLPDRLLRQFANPSKISPPHDQHPLVPTFSQGEVINDDAGHVSPNNESLDADEEVEVGTKRKRPTRIIFTPSHSAASDSSRPSNMLHLNPRLEQNQVKKPRKQPVKEKPVIQRKSDSSIDCMQFLLKVGNSTIMPTRESSTPALKIRNLKLESSPSSLEIFSPSAAIASCHWTNAEIADLNRYRMIHDVTKSDFWAKVADSIGTDKTGQQCRDRWFNEASAQPKAKKPSKKKQNKIKRYRMGGLVTSSMSPPTLS